MDLLVTEEIESRLRRKMPDAEIAVAGAGNRFEISVVSAAFEGMSRVKRQQTVYAAIQDLIASGAVHAVTIKAATPAERR